MKLQTILVTGFLMVSQFATAQNIQAQSSRCAGIAHTNIKRYYQQTLEARKKPGHQSIFVQGFRSITANAGIKLVNESNDLSAQDKVKAIADLNNSQNSAFIFITATRSDSRLKLTLSDAKCEKVNTYTLDYQ